MNKYSSKDIENYYHHTKFAYNTFWKMNQYHALHYGYWDETTSSFQDALRRENEILAKMANIQSSDYVLDAGCGVGGTSIYLAIEIGCKVEGITLSKYQIEQAKKNAMQFNVNNNTNFSHQDYSQTNFDDNTFDVIWGLESVCHANSKKEFLKEAYRLLKPNGRLIVADYFLVRKPELLEDIKYLNDWTQGWVLPHLATVSGFKSLMDIVGFKNDPENSLNPDIFIDATENAMPSSKRLHDVSKKAKPIVAILKFLKLRNNIHYNNIKASIAQYKLLEKNLWQYGIFYGIKK